MCPCLFSLFRNPGKFENQSVERGCHSRCSLLSCEKPRFASPRCGERVYMSMRAPRNAGKHTLHHCIGIQQCEATSPLLVRVVDTQRVVASVTFQSLSALAPSPGYRSASKRARPDPKGGGSGRVCIYRLGRMPVKLFLPGGNHRPCSRGGISTGGIRRDTSDIVDDV